MVNPRADCFSLRYGKQQIQLFTTKCVTARALKVKMKVWTLAIASDS